MNWTTKTFITTVILLQMITTVVQCVWYVFKFYFFYSQAVFLWLHSDERPYLWAGQYQFLVNFTCIRGVLSVCQHWEIICTSSLYLSCKSPFRFLLTYASSLQYSFQRRPSALKHLSRSKFWCCFGLVGSGRVKKYGPVENSWVSRYIGGRK